MNFKKTAFAIFMIALSFTLGMNASYAKELPKDVEFVDLNGKSIHLSDYKGKWVIVNLWATWCPPCLVEIPDLVMFQQDHKGKDAVVLGVNYESSDPQKVKNFADSQMMNYPIVRFKGKVDGKTTPFGPLKGLPTTYMVTPKGEIVAARVGMVNQKMLDTFMSRYTAMQDKKENKDKKDKK